MLTILFVCVYLCVELKHNISTPTKFLAEIVAQPHFGLDSGACPQFCTLCLFSLENNNASRNIEGATTGRRAPQL